MPNATNASDRERIALISAITLVVASSLVPALFSEAEGFGSVGLGIAALISLTWFVKYHSTHSTPFQ